MSAKQQPIDRSAVAYLIGATLCGVAAGYWGQPSISGNTEARDVIVTLFSILAGFLVAIMTLVGDPLDSPGRSWRAHEQARDTVFARLARQKMLFYAYLLTLGLLFISVLSKEQFPVMTVWVERAYVGLATTAFLLSLRLPSILMQIQMDRHDDLIEQKRAHESTDL
jgi:hypothetical protein